MAVSNDLPYFGRMRKVTPLATVLMLLVFVAGAEAKSPPEGNYGCYIDSYYQSFGNITISSASGFKRFGQAGTYRAGKRRRSFAGGSVKGYPIRFKGGGLNGFTGYWYISSGGKHHIALQDPGLGFVGIYCAD